MAQKKLKPEPLTENELKKAVMDLAALNAEYNMLDIRYDILASRILATLKPKDVRRYDHLRCTIVQALRRSVPWKTEASRLAHKLYPTAKELRQYVVGLARRYPKAPIKPVIKLSVIKESVE